MKKISEILCTLLVASAAPFSANAQDNPVFLASSSAKNPLERPIWSVEQAQKWFDENGPIIGVNHPEIPCDAVTNDEALAKAAEIGFNSVRWWPNGGDFINSVEEYAAIAEKHGLTCAPVFDFFSIPTTSTDSLKMVSKVKEVVKHFRNDKRIIMWDIWNEPDMSGANCAVHMKWIRHIAQWCREAGCTQAITSSILWDPENYNENSYTTVRRAAEAEMDLHNFHDYVMCNNQGTNINYVINRLKKIDTKPLICTECLTRTNGSGVAMSLSGFSKNKIGFYTWGLYACDPNWEVRWGRSTFNAYEPMFHNLLFAGGDPYDERELEYIKTFKYQEGNTSVYPGPEVTERWTRRRAWKWVDDEAWKGLYASSVSEAESLIAKHAADSLYNCISVRLSYDDYASKGSKTYRSSISTLADKAKSAGMKVIPVLTTSNDLSKNTTTLSQYISNIISNFYTDSRFAGWCVFEQTADSEPTNYASFFQSIFSYIRYTFPNQPMFATPKIASTQVADSTATDYVNYMWQLSDITAFTTSGNADVNESTLKGLQQQYSRPVYFMNVAGIQNEFAKYHVNWSASADLEPTKVKGFAFEPFMLTEENDNNKMPSWKAWALVGGTTVKGLSYSSLDNAIAGISAQGPKGIYNSVQVRLDFKTYTSDRDQFVAQLNALLDSAAHYNMRVLPTLLDDRYATRATSALTSYVTDIVKTFNEDKRIIAWELYNRPCASSQMSTSKALKLIPQIFEAARSASPQRPVFVTPYVLTQSFASDFDYKSALIHGKRNGWSKLNYGNSNVSVTYMCWKLSDIASYNSAQNSPQLGWLNSIAYKFGRPVVCSKWETKNSTTIDETLDVFKDHHAMWFVDGTLDDSKVRDFAYKTITTGH